MVQRLKELHRMHMDHHGSPDLIDDHLLEREFSVMSVVFSNRWVTHLRDLDARDGFGNIWKHRVMIYERGNSLKKSEIVLAKSKIVSVESKIVLG
jgi:hypothetical protein